MKPAHFFFLFVAAILGYAAYDHAASVKASFAHDVGAGAVGEFLDRAQVADGTLKEAGSIVTDVVHVLRKPAAADPAPSCPCGPDCDCRKPKEAKPEPVVQVCDGGTCRLVPASQAPVHQNCADGSCSSGSCGVRGFRLFGRRR